MLQLSIERVGELVVIGCQGRIVRNEAAVRLREAVKSLQEKRIVVLDLSQVSAIEGAGLGMLRFLQRWAHDHGVQLKLFNPINSVRNRLEHVSPTPEFHIATLPEIMALLGSADSRFALAA